jgi:hypothetical protein
VLVTGLADFGGAPYRATSGLDAPVQGIIPIGSTLFIDDTTYGCEDGRNWFKVQYAPQSDGEPLSVWLTDGADGTYWLEPVSVCGSFTENSIAFSYLQALVIDGVDAETGTLRFSSEFVDGQQLVRRYFEMNVRTGLITPVTYWHADLITRELTDRLGITDQVFTEDGPDYTAVIVSPDREWLLYELRNPPIEDCAHGCQTTRLYMARTDGSDARVLIPNLYASINQVTWHESRLALSLGYLEVWWPDFGLLVCRDGSCIQDDRGLLEQWDLPFDTIQGVPIFSPNGRRVVLTVWSENLQTAGVLYLNIALDLDTGRFIALPDDGGTLAQITWSDDDTLVYPIFGSDQTPAEGLPDRLYTLSGLWRVLLDFDANRYVLNYEYARWQNGSYAPIMGDDAESIYTLLLFDQRRAILYNGHTMGIACLSQG